MIIISPALLVSDAIKTHRPSAGLAFRDAGANFEAIARSQILDLPMDVTCTAMVGTILTQMLDFAKSHDWQTPLLVSCTLGLSRSPAAAMIIACATNPSRDEAEIAKALRRAAPCSDPHLMMIAAADEMLDRDGRMIDALDEMGPPRGECIGQIGELKV